MLALLFVGLFVFGIVSFFVALIMDVVLLVRMSKFYKKELTFLINDLSRMGDEHNAQILSEFYKDIVESKYLGFLATWPIVTSYLPHYLSLLVGKYSNNVILIKYKKLQLLTKIPIVCWILVFLIFGLLIALMYLKTEVVVVISLIAFAINIVLCVRVIFGINKYPKDIDALYEHYCNRIEKQS